MTVDSTRPAPGAENILRTTPLPRRTGTTVEVHHVAVRDPRVRPLLEDLHAEYNSRYGPNEEINRYPDERFAPEQGGAFLILAEDGQTVAGGAFFRRDEETAELKRIWTHPDHRRRGLGVAVVRELEREAARQGYRRIYLTTGPRQPEAAGLYLATGYTPLYDQDADPETIGPHPFEKTIRETRTD